MQYLFVVILFLLCPSVQSTQPKPQPLAECVGQAMYGFPTFKRQSITPICRKGYVSFFDRKANIPAFVAYVLRPENAVGCLSRESFEADESVGRIPSAKDYAKSGYDVGHLANAADMAWNKQVSDQAGYMTNMAPQVPGFNRGIWKKLEDGTRGWALSRQAPIQVYVAPVYDYKQDSVIGKNAVTVPHGFVKVLIDTTTQDVQIFMFANKASTENLNSFITSLARIQSQTGIEFPMPSKPVFSQMLWKVDLKSARSVKTKTCGIPN